MPGKELNQVGLNRAMFVMLKWLGGRIVIKAHEIENGNTDDAMKIQYDPDSKVFVFTLHKAKDNENISRLLIPGRN